MTHRTLLLTCALAAATAAPAAAGGVNLSWDDCGVAGREQRVFACDTDAGVPSRLVASFEPDATMTDFVAIEWLIELGAAAGSWPPWWELKGTGQCRDGSMSLDTDFTAGPLTCVDPWAGAVGAQGVALQIGYPAPPTARIVGVAALPSSSPTTVTAGSEHYAFKLLINRARTTGPDACVGCNVGVCLLLSEINVVGLSGQHKVRAPLTRSYAIWQDGNFFNCIVPTLPRTWGQVKSLYR